MKGRINLAIGLVFHMEDPACRKLVIAALQHFVDAPREQRS